MLRPRVVLVVALVIAACLLGPDAAGGDWPQFRGPGSDGALSGGYRALSDSVGA